MKRFVANTDNDCLINCSFTDNLTKKIYIIDEWDRIVGLLNNIWEQTLRFENHNQELVQRSIQYEDLIDELKLENKALKNNDNLVECECEIAKLKKQLKETTDLLNKEINTSVENINVVSETTVQLDDIKSVISNAVTDLSAVSEESSATNEEVSASTDTVAVVIKDVSDEMNKINEIANDLKDTITFFKI